MAVAPHTFGCRPGEPAPNRGARYPVEILSPAEVRAMIGACGRGLTGIRNQAILALLWRSGLRIAEVLALHARDVDLERGAVNVRRGKGGRQRTVGCDPMALAIVERWVTTHRRLAGERGWPSSTLLFVTVRRGRSYRGEADAGGRPLHDDQVRDVMQRLARRLGIVKRVHPHGLRHCHAFELAAEGVPINVIQAQLGHTSLATTTRYLAHVAPAQLLRAMQAREWPEDAPGGSL